MKLLNRYYNKIQFKSSIPTCVAALSPLLSLLLQSDLLKKLVLGFRWIYLFYNLEWAIIDSIFLLVRADGAIAFLTLLSSENVPTKLFIILRKHAY
jgi:hypothetical protein